MIVAACVIITLLIQWRLDLFPKDRTPESFVRFFGPHLLWMCLLVLWRVIARPRN